MILTLSDLRQQVLRNLDEDGDTGTTKQLVDGFLNQANQTRTMEYADQLLVWDVPATLTTEVGRQTYALHEEFMRPLYFFNRTTKDYLHEVPERQLGPEGFRWNDASGPAQNFVLWGRTQVKRQPTSASVITIVSDNAADTGGDESLDVMVRGETASGNVRAEVLSPAGLTPVSTENTYVKIMQVTKAGPWTGVMTMTANDEAVLMLELDHCELGKNYQQLFLLESPTAAEPIEYRFYRNPVKMVNDYDQSDIPFPFTDVLVWDALILMGGYNTEINPQALGLWQAMQQKQETALRQAMIQGQSLEARVRFVRAYGTTSWR